MSSTMVFDLHLALGYLAWLPCFAAYAWPKLKAMDPIDAHRAIAALHGFRFFGLVFILPGVVGPSLPQGFATFAAYGDLATGVLAMLAFGLVGVRRLFWTLVVAFNLVGVADLLVDYYQGVTLKLGDLPGQLGATYIIPIVYVPILMITHLAAFILLARRSPKTSASPAATRPTANSKITSPPSSTATTPPGD